jgi:deoxyinosine 3'endonuclease (endonuclease V)
MEQARYAQEKEEEGEDEEEEERAVQEMKQEQERMRYLVKFEADFDIGSDGLLVGGFDISFFKGQTRLAVACLAVTDMNGTLVRLATADVVLPDFQYTSGLLGFREIEAYRQVWEKYCKDNARHIPSVCMVDGNGILHPRRFGSACQVGVELGIPTIGVAKNLLCIEGLKRDTVQNDVQTASEYIYELPNSNFPSGKRVCLSRCVGLLTKDGSETLGHAMIVRSNENEERSKPIYVSVGHRVSHEDACTLTCALSLYRVPEPVRQADILGRQRVRQIECGEVIWQE